MSDRILTANDVVQYSRLLVAIHGGLKIRVLWDNGMIVEGTLRGLTQRQDDSTSMSADTDVRDAWVRITTVQGVEVYYLFVELVQALQEGALSVD